MKSLLVVALFLMATTAAPALTDDCIGSKFDPTPIDQQFCAVGIGYPYPGLVPPHQVAAIQGVPGTPTVKYVSSIIQDMAEQAYIAHRFETAVSATE
jgi:hypothetical protein